MTTQANYTITYYYADGTNKAEKPRSVEPEIDRFDLPPDVALFTVSAPYPLEHELLTDDVSVKKSTRKGELEYSSTYFPNGEILTYREALKKLKEPDEIEKLRAYAYEAINYSFTVFGKTKNTEPEDLRYIRSPLTKSVYVFKDNDAVLTKMKSKNSQGARWNKINNAMLDVMGPA